MGRTHEEDKAHAQRGHSARVSEGAEVRAEAAQSLGWRSCELTLCKVRDLGCEWTLPSPCTVCAVISSQIGTCGSQISAVSDTVSDVSS